MPCHTAVSGLGQRPPIIAIKLCIKVHIAVHHLHVPVPSVSWYHIPNESVTSSESVDVRCNITHKEMTVKKEVTCKRKEIATF